MVKRLKNKIFFLVVLFGFILFVNVVSAWNFDNKGISQILNYSINGSSVNHNDLTAIQGGSVNEYYHLNESVYNYLMANVFDWVTSSSGNASWNQSYAETIFALNQTLTDIWSDIINIDYNVTGLIRDWNESGWIRNQTTAETNWNASGLIQDWNTTGYIRDWAGTGDNSSWNQSYAKTINDLLYFGIGNWNATNTSYALNQTLTDMWTDFLGATNTSYYLVSNPFGYYNITTLPDLNATGLIQDWNSTGFIRDWSGIYRELTNLTFVGNINVTANSTFGIDLFPQVTLTSNIGSGKYRWAWLYVANISSEYIDAYGITASENISAPYFLGSGQFLTDLPISAEIDPKWTSNYTTYELAWLNTTNLSYLLIDKWNATNISYLLVENWNATNTSYREVYNLTFVGNITTTLDICIPDGNCLSATGAVEVDPYWTANFTSSEDAWLNTTNITYNSYNSTGLIRDWNISNWIIDWNSTGYIRDWGIPEETDPKWTVNYTASESAWLNTTNLSYLLIDKFNVTNISYMLIENWNATNTSYALNQTLTDIWADIFTTTNTSYLMIDKFNVTNTSYYPIWNPYSYYNVTTIGNLPNTNNYWNTTFATFNKTFADTLYFGIGNWNATNTSYYLLSNPYAYYNSTTIGNLPNTNNYWNNTYATFNKTFADTLYFGIGNWNATNTSYRTLNNLTFVGNGTFTTDVCVNNSNCLSSITSGNSSWNQSYADLLYARNQTLTDIWTDIFTTTNTSYLMIDKFNVTNTSYYLLSNPYAYYNITTIGNLPNTNNYWNNTYATFNKTYADTLYFGIGNWNATNTSYRTLTNITFVGNLSATLDYCISGGNCLSSVTGDNSSWNQSYANLLYNPILSQLGNTTTEMWNTIDNGTFAYNQTLANMWASFLGATNTTYRTNYNLTWVGNLNSTGTIYSEGINNLTIPFLFNSTGLIRNWNISSYIMDWNISGWIRNQTISETNWNSSGWIANWNATGYIRDWSFTEVDPKWTANITNYFTKAQWNVTNSSYYLASNPNSYWNTTFATFNKTYADTLYSTIKEPLWTANITNYFTKAQWNATNTTYRMGMNNTIASNMTLTGNTVMLTNNTGTAYIYHNGTGWIIKG